MNEASQALKKLWKDTDMYWISHWHLTILELDDIVTIYDAALVFTEI